MINKYYGLLINIIKLLIWFITMIWEGVMCTPIPGGAQVDTQHDMLWLGWIFHQNGDTSPPYWRMKCLLVFSVHQDLMLLCLDQLALVQGISSAVLINVPLF